MAQRLFNELQAELHQLKAEAAKKCPRLRDAAERVDRHLRDIADSGATSDAAVAAALRDSEETLQPGLFAIETKTSKFVQLGMSYFQRLASHDAIDSTAFSAVGQTLRAACEGTDENVQLKVLQAIVAIMQAPGLLASAKATFQMMECLLALFNNRNPTISNTAAATLRQSMSSLFEHIEANEKDAGDGGRDASRPADATSADSSAAFLENACSLFREMSLLAERGQSKELRFKPISTAQTEWLCLEVVDTCLRAHHALFDRHELLGNVFRESTCPMVVSRLQTLLSASAAKKENAFGLSVRVMRVTSALLSHVPVGRRAAEVSKQLATVVSLLTQMTCPEYPLFHRMLALEVIFSFTCGDKFAERVKMLHAAKDVGGGGEGAEKGVVGLIHGLERVIHRSLGVVRLQSASVAAIGQAKATLEALATTTEAVPKTRLLQLLRHSGAEPPAGLATDSGCVDLALASLSNLISAVGQLCGVPASPFDDDRPRRLADKPSCDLNVLVLNVQVVREIVDGGWEPMLEALQTVMVSVLAPCVLQRVLRAYTSFVQTCGALQLVAPRDRALAPLCKFAVPSPTAEGSMAPLYAHHILMCKALLSLVLDLGGILGETWLVVLEALQRLDSALVDRGHLPVLHSQAAAKGAVTNGAEGTDSAAASQAGSAWSQSRLEAELIKLRTVLDLLFEQTATLDEATAIQLMSALCRVSLSSISDARPDILTSATSGKGERMFGVEKLVEIVKCNLFRVGRLWEPAMAQLRQLAMHSRRSVRQYGMACITQLVVASFKHRSEAGKASAAAQEAAAKEAPSELKSPKGRTSAGDFDEGTELEFDMERRLLAVYEELYRCAHVDTKNYVLDGLYTVLQSCGEEVGPAWPMILAMLKGVAQDKEAQQQDKDTQQIKRAFMCVQLIRNDLLSALPVDCLQLFLTTIGAFGLQDTDLNISLTAITLLWNIADFFGRERPALLAAFAAVGGLSPPPSPSSRPTDETSFLQSSDDVTSHRREVHNVDQLWLVLYQQLRFLAVDARLEVRNSALRTLFTALETHGNVLDKTSWRQVIEELLLRVLDDVEQSALQSASDTPVERPLGPATAATSGPDGGRGAQQMMLIHHSRNTLAKQWHVSWETAFQGVMRMMMMFFDKVCQLEGAHEVWASLMQHLGACLVRGSDPVVASSMAALHDLLNSTLGAAAGSPTACALPRSFWQAVWNALDLAILAVCRLREYSPNALKAVLTQLGAIVTIPGACQCGLVDEETLRRYVAMLDAIICAPFAAQAANGQATIQDLAMGSVTAATKLLRAQPPAVEEALWETTCVTLLQHLPAEPVRYAWAAHLAPPSPDDRPAPEAAAEAAAARGGGGGGGAAVGTELNSKLMGLVAGLLEAEAPPHVQGGLLERVSLTMLAAMCTARYAEPQRDLWRRGAEAWMRTMRAGVPALNASPRQPPADKERVWLRAAAGLRSFTLPSDGEVGAQARESLEEAQRSELVDVAVVAFAVDFLLPAAPSPEVQAELLRIVDGAAAALQRMPAVSLAEPGVPFRLHLAQRSLDALFDITAAAALATNPAEAPPAPANDTAAATRLALARLAAPVLVRRCGDILESYVRDEAEAASCPLPRARTEQAVATARRLEQLQLDPAISEHLYANLCPADPPAATTAAAGGGGTRREGDGRWGRSGRRGHLVLLYGPLCRCIAADNGALRDSVRASLEMVGWELALGGCPWNALVGRAGAAPSDAAARPAA